MKFDLTKAKFIPQSNVKSKELSLDNLVTIKVKEEIKYDLVFNKAKRNWKIDKFFIFQQLDNEGWTASFQDGYVFLIKTNTSQVEELSPKFLKGTCQPIFSSDYFTLIMGEIFDLTSEEGFFLNEEEFKGDIKVYSVSTVKTNLDEFFSDSGESVKEENIVLPITLSSLLADSIEQIGQENPDLFENVVEEDLY